MISRKLLDVVYHSKIQYIIRFLVYYLRKAPFHGLPHLARQDLNLLQFLFWVCSIIILVAVAFRCCILRFNDYLNSEPILIVRKNFLQFETALPAFTFCPHESLDQRKAQQLLDSKSVPLKDRSKTLKLLKELGKRSILSGEKFIEHDFAPWINSTLYLELVFNFSIQHDVLTQNGDYGDRIFTDFGICYTFYNMLADTIKTENWGDRTQDNNIQNRLPLKVSYRNNYPLGVMFKFSNTSAIFDLYIHSPYEIPTIWSRKALELNASSVKTWVLVFKMVEIVNDRKTSNCRNMNESSLKMFPKIYSQNLCLIECRTRYALKLCGCIPHFYAVKEIIQQSPTLPICSTFGLNCLAVYGPVLAKLHGNSKLPFRCHCLPSCEGLDIEFKIKRVEPGKEHNEVKCFLSQSPRLCLQRSELFSELDLAVSIGNFLSVFFGFSLLGVVETVYFFTLRLFWYRRGYLGEEQL